MNILYTPQSIFPYLTSSPLKTKVETLKICPSAVRRSDRSSEPEGFHPFLFRLSLFSFLFFRRFLKKTPLFDLLKKSFFLELTFKRFQCFFNIISKNFYIQNSLSPSLSCIPVFVKTSLIFSESCFAASETALFSWSLRSCLVNREYPVHE